MDSVKACIKRPGDKPTCAASAGSEASPSGGRSRSSRRTLRTRGWMARGAEGVPAPSTSATNRVHVTPSGPMRRAGSASRARTSRSESEVGRTAPVKRAPSAAPTSLSGSMASVATESRSRYIKRAAEVARLAFFHRQHAHLGTVRVGEEFMDFLGAGHHVVVVRSEEVLENRSVFPPRARTTPRSRVDVLLGLLGTPIATQYANPL